MGAFYTNVTVKHADVDAVIAVLEKLGRDAFVTPAQNGAVVVFDAHIESQDARDIDRLASPISKRLRSVVLLALNHDDDLLYYALLEGGRLIDEYNSRPGYFDGTEQEATGGDARKLAAAFGVPDRADPLDRLLHATGYAFETERHAALVQLLGLPPAAVGSGYDTISQGELPEGVLESELRVVGAAAVRRSSPPAPRSPTDAEGEALQAKLSALVQALLRTRGHHRARSPPLRNGGHESHRLRHETWAERSAYPHDSHRPRLARRLRGRPHYLRSTAVRAGSTPHAGVLIRSIDTGGEPGKCMNRFCNQRCHASEDRDSPAASVYSCRSATVGLNRAARNAGNKQAIAVSVNTQHTVPA